MCGICDSIVPQCKHASGICFESFCYGCESSGSEDSTWEEELLEEISPTGASASQAQNTGNDRERNRAEHAKPTVSIGTMAHPECSAPLAFREILLAFLCRASRRRCWQVSRRRRPRMRRSIGSSAAREISILGRYVRVQAS